MRVYVYKCPVCEDVHERCRPVEERNDPVYCLSRNHHGNPVACVRKITLPAAINANLIHERPEWQFQGDRTDLMNQMRADEKEYAQGWEPREARAEYQERMALAGVDD